MAEFRRDRGGMESSRGPQYRSALLPWEQQFCETLDISADEYFAYYDLVSQYVEEEKGRELIPDVRNEAVTIVTLVVGLHCSGQPVAGTSLRTRRKNRAILSAQDVEVAPRSHRLRVYSIQELATLGSLVP